MKIRSKALLQYLTDTGALRQGEEAINTAKREYRRIYKRDHKRKQKKKEVRPQFSPKEYEALSIRAKLHNLCPTAYAKEVILQAQELRELIPDRQTLLCILQKLSMAGIASVHPDRTNEVPHLLYEAEALLLKYLEK